MKPSVEYPATVSGVKRGLKAIGYTQDRAAKETQQSPAIVSMTLAKKVKSQPCLNKLAALIARVMRGESGGSAPGGRLQPGQVESAALARAGA